MNESRDRIIYFFSVLAFLELKNDFIKVKKRRTHYDIHMNENVIWKYVERLENDRD